MTLTEIAKACEDENYILDGKMFDFEPPELFSEQIEKRLQATNNLIKELALHVKQLNEVRS